MRVRIEELDLPLRAYNTLKACNVDFIDEIRSLLASSDPLVRQNQNLERVRGQILERLRRWEDGEEGQTSSRV